MAIVHTTMKVEDDLRGIGFEIPRFPKLGAVKLGDRVVGRIDNFTGLITTDKEAVQLLIDNEDRLSLSIFNRDERD